MRLSKKLKSILGLSLQLAKADFKLKNENSYLGTLWYLLDPLLMFAILLTIRRLVGKGIEHYPLYLLLGLIIFNFFRKTTGSACSAIQNNANLIKSIKLDHEVFVIAILLKSIFSHFFEMALFAVFLVVFKVPVLNIVFYPLIFGFFCLFVFGVSCIVSTVGVYISDFKNVWSVLLRLLWFATPIFYSAKLQLPFNFKAFNPMYYYITVARKAIVYNQAPEAWMVFGLIAFSLGFFIFGILIFKSFKNKFAELI